MGPREKRRFSFGSLCCDGERRPVSSFSCAPRARQVSNEVRFILPILISILVAKSVADAMTHDLYHGLLEVKCVPFLPPEPNSKPEALDLYRVHDICKKDIITFNETVRHPLPEPPLFDPNLTSADAYFTISARCF
jgi:hypothetical protein